MNTDLIKELEAQRGGELAPNAYDHLRDQFESIFRSPSALASWRRKQTITGDLSDEYMEMRVQFAWLAFQAAHRIGQKEAFAAPDRAPSTDSAADARDAALWIALTADIASESCKAYCFIDDMGDWQDRNRALIDAKHAELWRKLNTDAETLRECRSLLDGLTDWKRAHAASLPQTKEE